VTWKDSAIFFKTSRGIKQSGGGGGEIDPSPLPESVQKYSKIAGNKFSWKLAVIFK
jgi:hypothetical protein